jgi:hypothetical protein
MISDCIQWRAILREISQKETREYFFDHWTFSSSKILEYLIRR